MKVPKRVLLIDDDPDIVVFFTGVLIKEGYEVIPAITCEEGLEKARTMSPNLIVTDFNTKSKLNGIQLCQQLREDDATKNIPTIVVTGHLTSELNIPPHIEVWIVAVLNKPFHYRRLLETIEASLKELPPVAIPELPS